MKKNWKHLRKGMALTLCLALLSLLTACGGDSKESPSPSQPAAEVSYTFTGAYNSSQSDVHFDFTLEMLSDGTLAMTPGVVFLDVEDYEATASGRWSESNGTLSFNIDNEDGTFSKDYEVSIENGGYQFAMDLSLASFVRPVTMTCTTQGFIPTTPEEPSNNPEGSIPPEGSNAAVAAQFEYANDTGSMAGAIKLLEDGTVFANYDMVSMNHTLIAATGTWTKDGDNYVISLNADENNEAVTLTSADGTVTWAFSYSGGGEIHSDEITLTLAETAQNYPANTMLLNFMPDTSEQLKTTFFCESGVWGPALGASGSYAATDSTDELFAWSNEGSYILSFKADGTYEYQFEKVGIVENGTWTFEGWTLTATTANGSTYTAEITK